MELHACRVYTCVFLQCVHSDRRVYGDSFMLLLEHLGSTSPGSAVSLITLSQSVESTLSCSANHTEGGNCMHGDS